MNYEKNPHPRRHHVCGPLFNRKAYCLAKYDITLFNRGKSNVDLFKEVKQIHGNRETADIEKIYCQHWDCIFDFSGYYPNTFAQLLDGIKGKVGRYVFISTVSVRLSKIPGPLNYRAKPNNAMQRCSKSL